MKQQQMIGGFPARFVEWYNANYYAWWIPAHSIRIRLALENFKRAAHRAGLEQIRLGLAMEDCAAALRKLGSQIEAQPAPL